MAPSMIVFLVVGGLVVFPICGGSPRLDERLARMVPYASTGFDGIAWFDFGDCVKAEREGGGSLTFSFGAFGPAANMCLITARRSLTVLCPMNFNLWLYPYAHALSPCSYPYPHYARH